METSAERNEQHSTRPGRPNVPAISLHAQLAALADALGVTADYLIGRESAKKNGGGPIGRARRVFEAVARMPRHQQNKVIDVVEAFVLREKEGG